MSDSLPSGAEGQGPLSPPRAPRWVKLSGITLAVVVLVMLVVMLIGGGPGEHGPGRHGVGTGQTSTDSERPHA